VAVPVDFLTNGTMVVRNKGRVFEEAAEMPRGDEETFDLIEPS
jgi:hypothetical protein